MESALRREGAVSQWNAVAAGIAAGDERWSVVLRLIAAEYPYCTMSGVHVADGCIIACEGIQSSFVFNGSDSDGATVEPTFDGYWKSLRALCAKLGSGRLAEIRFSRGRPVSARMNAGGRRFRRLVIKVPAALERSPMS